MSLLTSRAVMVMACFCFVVPYFERGYGCAAPFASFNPTMLGVSFQDITFIFFSIGYKPQPPLLKAS